MHLSASQAEAEIRACCRKLGNIEPRRISAAAMLMAPATTSALLSPAVTRRAVDLNFCLIRRVNALLDV